ncbi:MarR family winged helix-turn-helix transcriptional regulator [Marinobacter sp. OP 3.4]|uniref:MarR family winged helix-turn-helix transcriptional regulator n=1 Tax=Marinobacter sp. OP 3.4 TaxID=3076501 RepID=UPI002E1C82CA
MTVKSPVSNKARPQGCTNYRIRQLMRQVSQFYDAELGQAGLKGTQYALMAHVIQLGPVRPGDLARAMKMDASTLTRNLKPLLDAGWLAQSPGPDRRSRTIVITDDGRQKWHQAREHWKRAQQRINGMLGEDRVMALHSLIDESLDLLAPHEPTGADS